MCQYSATAENQRDAFAGEDLVITGAPHCGSNWLTEEGIPGRAVCVPDTAMLAVQLPGGAVRGAMFAHRHDRDDRGHFDFIVYIDGEKERIALDDLPSETRVRVLTLYSVQGAGGVPAVIPAASPEVGLIPEEDLEDLEEVLATAESPRGSDPRYVNFLRRYIRARDIARG